MHWQELALHYLLMSFYKGFSTGWAKFRRAPRPLEATNS